MMSVMGVFSWKIKKDDIGIYLRLPISKSSGSINILAKWKENQEKIFVRLQNTKVTLKYSHQIVEILKKSQFEKKSNKKFRQIAKEVQ